MSVKYLVTAKRTCVPQSFLIQALNPFRVDSPFSALTVLPTLGFTATLSLSPSLSLSLSLIDSFPQHFMMKIFAQICTMNTRKLWNVSFLSIPFNEFINSYTCVTQILYLDRRIQHHHREFPVPFLRSSQCTPSQEVIILPF